MKRITPIERDGEKGYPTAREAGLDRRGFMKVLVGGSAAAVGTLVLGEDRASARGVMVRPRYRVLIDLKPPVSYKGCKSAITQIVARTYDRNMHAFLQRQGERAGVLAAVRKALLQGRCADLQGTARYRLGRSVGVALQNRFRKRTGRKGGYCWVRLQIQKKT